MTEREALIQEITEGIEAKRRTELPPEQQQQQQKYVFGGREWNSQQEAEAAALAGYQQRDAAMQELQRVREQASKSQPASTQLDTGRAPTFDSEAYLKKSLEDPREAHRMVLREALFGDANAKADPFLAIQNMMMKTIQLEQQADQQRVRSEHPEIPWGDERAEQLIAQQREKMALPSNYQGTHAAIRELQGMGVMPTRRDLQTWQEGQQKAQQPQPINARKDVLWSTVRQDAAPTLAPLPSGGGSPGGSMSDLSEQQLHEFFDNSKNDLGKQREFLNELRRRAVRTA